MDDWGLVSQTQLMKVSLDHLDVRGSMIIQFYPLYYHMRKKVPTSPAFYRRCRRIGPTRARSWDTLADGTLTFYHRSVSSLDILQLDESAGDAATQYQCCQILADARLFENRWPRPPSRLSIV